MPLVTITCQEDWYPKSPPGDEPVGTVLTRLTINLVYDLAAFIGSNVAGLGLDLTTTENDVQVDLREFHWNARNTPQIGVLIQFTEPPTPSVTRS